MISYGVFVRYLVSEDWYVGIGVDFLKFDFERPYKLLSLNGAMENDADASNTIIRAWLEREFSPVSEYLTPFGSAGIGLGIPEADDIRGNLTPAGTYSIETDPGTEIIPSLGCGLRYQPWDRLGLEIGVRLDYHIADWEVKDRVSGRKTTLDDYFAYGAYLNAMIQF
jgi:hypothetical protein